MPLHLPVHRCWNNCNRNTQQAIDWASTRQTLQQQYKLGSIDTASLGIALARKKQGEKELDYLLHHPEAKNLVNRLHLLQHSFSKLEAALQQCLHEYEHKPVSTLNDELENIAGNTDTLEDLLPALRAYAALPNDLKNLLRTLPVNAVQAEATIAQKT